ncbi:hypothetical protein [Funiculus sociatus]|nr:hypothetical protein [Trichocoleus sp. FACHB-40]
MTIPCGSNQLMTVDQLPMPQGRFTLESKLRLLDISLNVYGQVSLLLDALWDEEPVLSKLGLLLVWVGRCSCVSDRNHS